MGGWRDCSPLRGLRSQRHGFSRAAWAVVRRCAKFRTLAVFSLLPFTPFTLDCKPCIFSAMESEWGAFTAIHSFTGVNGVNGSEWGGIHSLRQHTALGHNNLPHMGGESERSEWDLPS